MTTVISKIFNDIFFLIGVIVISRISLMKNGFLKLQVCFKHNSVPPGKYFP